MRICGIVHFTFTNSCHKLTMNKFEIPRIADRSPLRILVDGLVRSRQVYVDLFDLSEGGCKIKGRHGFVTEGETVNLKIAGFKTPLGTIARVEKIGRANV